MKQWTKLGIQILSHIDDERTGGSDFFYLAEQRYSRQSRLETVDLLLLHPRLSVRGVGQLTIGRNEIISSLCAAISYKLPGHSELVDKEATNHRTNDGRGQGYERNH